MPKITLEIEKITPALARELLEGGYDNRKLNQGKVIEYATVIHQGKWSPTASKIEIDEKGKLINGFHRLNAVIMANTPAEMLVHRGVPTSDRDVIDTGEKRKLADLYQMYTNKKYVQNQAALLNQCMDLLLGTGGSTHDRKKMRIRVQTLEAAQKWERVFKDGLDFVIEKYLGNSHDQWNGKFRNAYILGTLAFAYQRNPAATKKYAENLYLGESISSKDPVYTVRAMLMSMFNKETRNSSWRRDIPYKILSGLYCTIKNESYTKAQVSREAVDYFREAYQTAQVENLLIPYKQVTMVRELAMKALEAQTKTNAEAKHAAKKQ